MIDRLAKDGMIEDIQVIIETLLETANVRTLRYSKTLKFVKLPLKKDKTFLGLNDNW